MKVYTYVQRSDGWRVLRYHEVIAEGAPTRAAAKVMAARNLAQDARLEGSCMVYHDGRIVDESTGEVRVDGARSEEHAWLLFGLKGMASDQKHEGYKQKLAIEAKHAANKWMRDHRKDLQVWLY